MLDKSDHISILILIINLILVFSGSCYADDIVSSSICDLSKTDQKPIEFKQQQSGYYYLNVITSNSSKPINPNCEWIINSPISEKIIDISQLVLSSKDVFEIVKQDGNKTVTVYKYDTTKKPGLIFIKDPVNITLNLDKTDQKTKRTFNIIFYQDFNEIQLLKDSGILTFPLNEDVDSVLKDIDFYLQPGPQYSDRKVMLRFLGNTNATFSMDDKIYNVTVSKPDIYLAKKDSNSIKFHIENYPVKSNSKIQIEYWLVNEDCSAEFSLKTDTPSITMLYPNEEIRKSQSLTEMICAQIIQIQGNLSEFKFDEKMQTLPNPGDKIIVYSLPNLETLRVIDSSSLSYFKSIDSIFNNEKILIIYDSPYGSDSSSKPLPITIAITENEIYKLNDKNPQKVIQIKKTDSNKVINVYSELQKNLLIKFNPTKVDSNQMIIEIFNTDDLSSKIQPLVRLDKFDILPPALAINTDTMRIQLSGKFSDMELTVKHVESTDCAPVSTLEQAFKINGSYGCSWFIPQDSFNKFTILSPNFLNFDESSTLQIIQLSQKSVIIDTVKGPINESYLPDHVMDASSSYLINFTNTKPAYVFLSKKTNFLNTELSVDGYQKNYSLQSINYPGMYPVGFTQKWSLGSGNASVLISVEDFQLSDEHYISINYGQKSENITNKMDLESFPDSIGQLPLAVFFDTKSPIPFAARSNRGFNIQMTYFGCGGELNMNDPKNTHQIIKFNNSMIHDKYPLCIWLVNATNHGEKFRENVLNLNVTLGSKIQDSKANLKIYDDISLRNLNPNRILCNSTAKLCLNNDQQNGYYQLSIGWAMIVYNFSQSDMKKNLSLEIIINREKCEKNSHNTTYCAKTDRCITDLMVCNGYNDCGDWSDEFNCNSSIPYPPVPIPTGGGSGGVNVWVVIFVLMPIGAILGIFGYIFFPRILNKFNHGRYSEFRSDLSEVS